MEDFDVLLVLNTDLGVKGKSSSKSTEEVIKGFNTSDTSARDWRRSRSSLSGPSDLMRLRVQRPRY